jgi:hypothetical protein
MTGETVRVLTGPDADSTVGLPATGDGPGTAGSGTLGADEFRAMLREGLGLETTPEDLQEPLDQVVGWDSVHLLWLLTALEQRTGRRVALPAVLEAPTLGRMRELYAD